MHASIPDDANEQTADPEHERRYGFGTGVACSLVLHGIALTAFIFILNDAARPNNVPLVIPVNIVELAEQTVSPAQPVEDVVPQQKAGPPSSLAVKSAAISPTQNRPPPDQLEIKLRKLAALREPLIDTHSMQSGEGLSRISATRSDAALGPQATLENFLRNQIEHHWNPDLALLKGRNLSVYIRLAVTDAGVVTKAEVIKNPYIGFDPAYDDIAVSARNAALLASPLTLPPGRYAKSMDLVLDLDTRDAFR